MARRWGKRGHDAGDLKSTTILGLSIILDWERLNGPDPRGIIYVTMAAERGCALAAYYLGLALSENFLKISGNVSVKRAEAIKWFKKCLSPCQDKGINLSEEDREHVRNKIEEVENES